MDYYIDDYSDLVSSNLWTNAINTAIKKMKKGDKLIFKENTLYKSGTIYLKNNITLYFEEGSVLMASSNIDDFNINNDELKVLKGNSFNNCDYNGKPSLYFLFGNNVHDVTFDGAGIIDGNEEIFYGKQTESYIEGRFYPRMPLIYFEGAKNITFTNITVRNSAFWTIHLVGCDTVLVDNIKILNNRRMLNADGIDPDHSKNVTIKNSYIESADDCIVLKTTSAYKDYGDTENITIENCTLKSTSAAIKIGTETTQGFKNINISNIDIEDTNRAISFQLRDEGFIDTVNIDNIRIQTHMVDPLAFWGKAEAVSITAVKRNNDTSIGYIKNINISNLYALSEHGIFIYGTDNNISDISFTNTMIELYDDSEYDKNVYDLRPCEEKSLFKDESALIYVKNAKNVTFDGLRCTGNDLVIGDVEII